MESPAINKEEIKITTKETKILPTSSLYAKSLKKEKFWTTTNKLIIVKTKPIKADKKPIITVAIYFPKIKFENEELIFACYDEILSYLKKFFKNAKFYEEFKRGNIIGNKHKMSTFSESLVGY